MKAPSSAEEVADARDDERCVTAISFVTRMTGPWGSSGSLGLGTGAACQRSCMSADRCSGMAQNRLARGFRTLT
jgi:hypothetical protein